MDKWILYTNSPFEMDERYPVENYEWYKDEYDYTCSYEDWVFGELEMRYSDLCTDIKDSELSTYHWRVTGELGLWNGKRHVSATFDDIFKAFDLCTNNMEYYTISRDYDCIYIESVHHDGTNTFTLTPLEPRMGRYKQVKGKTKNLH